MPVSVEHSPTREHPSRVPFFLTCLLILIALIDSQIVGAITPQIAAGLSAAKPVIAASAAAYSVSAAAVALILGRYAGRIGTRAWLLAASVVFVVASLLAAAAFHVTVFFVARSLAGLAGGLISALAIAALANASTYAHRGKQMSGVAISYFLAPVLGVPLGTLIAGVYGWRTVYVFSAIAVGIAGALAWQFPTIPHSDQTVDQGNLGSSETSSGAWRSLWRTANRSRSTQMGIVSAFFVSGGLVGFTTFLGTWLSDAFYAGAKEVGLVYALAGIGAVAGGAIGGFMADRFGKRKVALRGSLGMAILLLVLPTFALSLTLLLLISITAFLAALRIAPLQALITELVAPGERAAYIALRNGASQLGIASSVVAGGFIYRLYDLAGVGIFCAALTAVAWLTLRPLVDPHEQAGVATAHATLWRRSRLLRASVAGALTLIILICGVLPWTLSFLITKARTRPDEKRLSYTPEVAGAEYEDATFVSSDGNRLYGWYLPSRSYAITIVLTHGLFRSRYEMFDRAIDLWKEGYGVLIYDLRRHGNSVAEFSTLGFAERHDVLSAMNYARKRAPNDKIVLLGVSMGAAASLLAASETGEVAAIIADSSFLSFSDTVYHHLQLGRIPTIPFAPLLTTFTAWRMNFMAADFDLRATVKRISVPILFIGGTADRRMPNATVLEPLYGAAPNPLKEKFIVQGATHGQAYHEDKAGYIGAINKFLNSAGLIDRPDT